MMKRVKRSKPIFSEKALGVSRFEASFVGSKKMANNLSKYVKFVETKKAKIMLIEFKDSEELFFEIMSAKEVGLLIFILVLKKEDISSVSLWDNVIDKYVFYEQDHAEVKLQGFLEEKCIYINYIVDFDLYNPINTDSNRLGLIGILLDDNNLNSDEIAQLEEKSSQFIDSHNIAIFTTNPENIPAKIFPISFAKGYSGKWLPERKYRYQSAYDVWIDTTKDSDHEKYITSAACRQIFINYIDTHCLPKYIFSEYDVKKMQVKQLRSVCDNNSYSAAVSKISQFVPSSSKAKQGGGVSIVTCTNRPQMLDNILDNYKRSAIKDKELIVVLNNDDFSIDKVREVFLSDGCENVQVYQLPQSTSLGYCTNFGVSKTSKGYIAKFDDDDYYSENYLTDLVNAFKYTDADIVGKISFYIYLENSKMLVLRNPGNSYKYCSFVPGASMLIRRKVFSQMSFADIPSNIDGVFCETANQLGLKIFSADSQNFMVFRRKEVDTHTWKVKDSKIIQQSRIVLENVSTLYECIKFVTT